MKIDFTAPATKTDVIAWGSLIASFVAGNAFYSVAFLAVAAIALVMEWVEIGADSSEEDAGADVR